MKEDKEVDFFKKEKSPKVLRFESESLLELNNRRSVTFLDIKNPVLQKEHTNPIAAMEHIPPDESHESDEEDYSASFNAVIQRRASVRKSKRRHNKSRRTSSPFFSDSYQDPNGPSCRRSSVFTTSSGDTAITVDENLENETTHEDISENIKIHKEVLSSVKFQPWSMRKKLKLVEQAKAYIKKHEGALQERLAQSHSTKDMWKRFKIYIVKKWNKNCKELKTAFTWFIPWGNKIKEIESHFGSVVASYFIFLRWLFWVNIVIATVLLSFVAIPEILLAHKNVNIEIGRDVLLPQSMYNATNFLTLWDFEGVFKYSPLFYGWYTNDDVKRGYRLPLAYFVTGLFVYGYSFFATLRKMAENSRNSSLSEKDDECVFSIKLFTAWDYMIGSSEAAHNRVSSIVMGFREALLEEAEKKRKIRNWKIIGMRVLVNIIVLGLLAFSVFTVIFVVDRSDDKEATSNAWRRNETTIVMSMISLIFPMVFEALGFFEQYHPRKQLRHQLARIMVLHLLNLYSLIYALFDKIEDEDQNILDTTESTALQLYTSGITTGPPCSELCLNTFFINASSNGSTLTALITSAAYNLAVTTYPKLQTIKNGFTSERTTQKIDPFTEQFKTTQSSITEKFNNSLLDSWINNELEQNDSNITSKLNTTRNETLDEQLSFGYVQEYFQDYLTFILSEVTYDNETNTTIFADINSTISTDAEKTTDFDTYKYLESTVPTLINLSITDIKTNVPLTSELTTLYDELTSTISSINEIKTSESPTIISTICPSECLFTSTNMPYSTVNTKYLKKTKSKLKCWETMFGQELMKLTVMDLIISILSTLMLDFFRGIFIRVMNRSWCWDLEKTFPQYGNFKVAESILHLVNNQGMVWMGLFFAPGLAVINSFKLFIVMYFQTWNVLTCNVPPEIIFRASRSNNFYYALLLMMLFLCVLPVSYAIVWKRPSEHCGPFSQYRRIFHILINTIKENAHPTLYKVLDYIASPGIVIPLLVLLILVIYYLISLTGSLKDSNEDLKLQLKKERTEERRKMFRLADKKRRGLSGDSNEMPNSSVKWKTLLNRLQKDSVRKESVDDNFVALQSPKSEEVKEDNGKNKARDMILKFIKLTPRKSTTSEDISTLQSINNTLPSHSKATLDEANNIKLDALKTQKTKKILKLQKNQNIPKESNQKFEPSTPQSQDSISSSIWTDNIPVITISKTGSNDAKTEIFTPDVSTKSSFQTFTSRRSIQKQKEIDTDSVFTFDENTLDETPSLQTDNIDADLTDKSSSEETKCESVDTIIDKKTSYSKTVSPTDIFSLETESSTSYKEHSLSQ